MLYDLNQNRSEGERNRIKLINMLRDKSQWPEGFRWNYSQCWTCAIGMVCIKEKQPAIRHHNDFNAMSSADIIWQNYTKIENLEQSLISKHLDLSPQDTHKIFARAWMAIGIDPEEEPSPSALITPQQVADLLEATLTPVEQLINQ